MNKLGFTSEWHYRQFWIKNLKYRKNEPNEMTREKSKLFNKIFRNLNSSGISISEMADGLSLYEKDIDELTFGARLRIVSENVDNRSASKNGSKNRKTSHLRLVE